MSIFSESVKRAIGTYRLMLRRYLPQTKRMGKLHALGLKNPLLYQNELLLYEAAYKIIEDIESNLNVGVSTSYYAYSGMRNFVNFFKDFLKYYEIEGQCVIHKAQKASNILIKAIQLLTLPLEKQNEETKKALLQCNRQLSYYASVEQKKLHEATIINMMHQYVGQQDFYQAILTDFQEKMRYEDVNLYNE